MLDAWCSGLHEVWGKREEMDSVPVEELCIRLRLTDPRDRQRERQAAQLRVKLRWSAPDFFLSSTESLTLVSIIARKWKLFPNNASGFNTQEQKDESKANWEDQRAEILTGHRGKAGMKLGHGDSIWFWVQYYIIQYYRIKGYNLSHNEIIRKGRIQIQK